MKTKEYAEHIEDESNDIANSISALWLEYILKNEIEEELQSHK